MSTIDCDFGGNQIKFNRKEDFIDKALAGTRTTESFKDNNDKQFNNSTMTTSSSSPQSAQNVQPPPTGPLSQHTVSSSVVLKSLSFLLGLFFIFIGAMKISPFLSKDLHKDLVSLND